MRDTVYHFVFDGLSDWEAALALAEVNQSEDYATTAVGLTAEPVTTAAGLRVQPDGALDAARAGLLDGRRHTSNMLGYIDGRVAGYGGAGRYESEQLAVTDGRVLSLRQSSC